MNPTSLARSRASAPAAERGEVPAGQMDFPPAGRVQPAQQMEQGALARAGSAAHRQELAAPHLQVHAAQDLERALAQRVGLVEAPGREQQVTHSATPPPV